MTEAKTQELRRLLAENKRLVALVDARRRTIAANKTRIGELLNEGVRA